MRLQGCNIMLRSKETISGSKAGSCELLCYQTVPKLQKKQQLTEADCATGSTAKHLLLMNTLSAVRPADSATSMALVSVLGASSGRGPAAWHMDRAMRCRTRQACCPSTLSSSCAEHTKHAAHTAVARQDAFALCVLAPLHLQVSMSCPTATTYCNCQLLLQARQQAFFTPSCAASAPRTQAVDADAAAAACAAAAAIALAPLTSVEQSCAPAACFCTHLVEPFC
jgi:hypothetical protein